MKIYNVTSKAFALKKSRMFAAAALSALGVMAASNVFAAPAADSAVTSATVVTPITIADAEDLVFGEFAAGTGGTVVVTTGSAVSDTGDTQVTAGTASAAEFVVSGQANETYSITITENNLTHTNTTDSMALATVHDLDASAGDNPATGTLNGSGTQTIYVGGTLTVGSAQAPGVYAGTVTATVNYN